MRRLYPVPEPGTVHCSALARRRSAAASVRELDYACTTTVFSLLLTV